MTSNQEQQFMNYESLKKKNFASFNTDQNLFNSHEIEEWCKKMAIINFHFDKFFILFEIIIFSL